MKARALLLTIDARDVRNGRLREDVMKQNKAFTLIELLVVISIIALLLSVLVPSLGKAKEAAKTVICKTNIKQWGTCFALYTNEYNDKFTLGFQDPPGWISYFEWIEKMEPYFETEDLFLCPSAKKYDVTDGISSAGVDYKFGKTREGWWYQSATSTSNEPDRVGSYGMNCWINSVAAPPFGTKEMYWQRSTGATKTSLSSVPLFMDSMWLGGYAQDSDSPSSREDWPDEHGQMSRFAIKRHKGGVSAVFLDQSIRNVGLKELWGLKWHTQFDTHNAQTKPEVVWPDWVNSNTR